MKRLHSGKKPVRNVWNLWFAIHSLFNWLLCNWNSAEFNCKHDGIQVTCLLFVFPTLSSRDLNLHNPIRWFSAAVMYDWSRKNVFASTICFSQLKWKLLNETYFNIINLSRYDRIAIYSTFYGRDDNTTCQHKILPSKGHCAQEEQRVNTKLYDLCQGESKCTVAATTSFLGKNNSVICPDVYKYARVIYRCIQHPKIVPVSRLTVVSTQLTYHSIGYYVSTYQKEIGYGCSCEHTNEKESIQIKKKKLRIYNLHAKTNKRPSYQT